MESRSLSSSSKVYECFLSGMTSEQCLMHALRIFDPLTNEVDEVFISDSCFRIICKGQDSIVAHMWSSYKQALSAGYSDTGFVSTLKTESRRLRFELMIVADPAGRGSHFCLLTKPLSTASGDLRLWCKNKIALPPRLIETAEKQVRVILAKPYWEWVNERWLIATPPDRNGNIERAQPPWNESLTAMACAEYGDPPDLFAYISGNLTLPGFELIRRTLL